MDFLLGLLFAFVLLYILINFVNVSVSDTQAYCNGGSNLTSDNFFKVFRTGQPVGDNVVTPYNGSEKKVLNGKLSLEQQSYDYQSQFYTYVR